MLDTLNAPLVCILRVRIQGRQAKNSPTRWLGSASRAEMTATESAPASLTAEQFIRVIPPIATSGLAVKARAARTPSSPTTGLGFSLDEVAYTGPMAT